ncbi:MAG: hypothetical protein M1832_006094 [Thelocarpon impressellum]|nr:MAG: hypothetical protein M1832_006094 [Thelocarpon impressellum]
MPIRPALMSQQQQLRGKKKLAKQSSAFRVKLLQDISPYGRRGAIVPVPAGRMRNDWYPRGVAEYVTEAQLSGDASAPRATSRPPPPPTPVADANVALLSPHRTTQLLTTLLPDRLDFYRKPIGSSSSPSEPASTGTAIYGSVSTADILASVRALLAADAEGKRVVLSPEDISFATAEGRGGDRVKTVGAFDIALTIPGAPTEQALRRRVVVHAEREAGEEASTSAA